MHSPGNNRKIQFFNSPTISGNGSSDVYSWRQCSSLRASLHSICTAEFVELTGAVNWVVADVSAGLFSDDMILLAKALEALQKLLDMSAK